MYLRYWAKELQIPILSIDYSLAPDAPFPQAVNEVYYAYIWALNNLEKLGSSGEKIIFCGDSAGLKYCRIFSFHLSFIIMYLCLANLFAERKVGKR